MKGIANFGRDQFMVVAPHVYKIYIFQILCFVLTFFVVFVNSPTDHNLQRVLMYDGSKDVV